MPTQTLSSSSTTIAQPTAAAQPNVQRVVVVNSSPEILTLAERVLDHGHYDVIVVESMAHAYTKIRRVQPNLVILCLELGDGQGFQLLTMLRLDPSTRGIPLLTYTAEDSVCPVDEEDDNPVAREFLARSVVALMN